MPKTRRKLKILSSLNAKLPWTCLQNTFFSFFSLVLEGYLHAKLNIWNALRLMKRGMEGKSSSTSKNDWCPFQPGCKIDTIQIHVEVKNHTLNFMKVWDYNLYYLGHLKKPKIRIESNSELIPAVFI